MLPIEDLPLIRWESYESRELSLFIRFLLSSKMFPLLLRAPETRMSLLLLLCMLWYMLDEMLDFREFILDERLNLRRLDAEPNMRSSQDFSLWLMLPAIGFLLSGVDYKLLVSWIFSWWAFCYLILSKKSSFSFLMHCAHSRSSLIVSRRIFLLIDQWILLSMIISYSSSSVMNGCAPTIWKGFEYWDWVTSRFALTASFYTDWKFDYSCWFSRVCPDLSGAKLRSFI